MSRADARLSTPRVIRDWEHWPQGIAPSESGRIVAPNKWHPRRRGKRAPRTYHFQLLVCCEALQARFPGLKRDDIVVFYPARLREHINRTLERKKNAGTLGELRGLVISATSRLRTRCMAFRIADVEAHKTPADPYFITITARPGKRLRPAPIYTAEESGIGVEVLE